MNNSVRQESRKFKVHENLIYHVIRSQSQGIDSAIKELVQNAIDAKATTCEIMLTTDVFSFKDNGTGFPSKEYVVDFFETFGTPHSEREDKVFGRFRMGRGQIMALASTQWLSGAFQMIVDLKERGLNYDLVETKEIQLGCSISGKWYEKLSQDESHHNSVLSVTKRLINFCRYLTSIKILLNQKVISFEENAIRQKIVFENDNCILLSQEDYFNNLHVYNLGIYTKAIPYARYRLAGDLITKKHLRLSIKRDQILDNCPVWEGIHQGLREYQKKLRKKISIPLSEFPGVVKEFVSGSLTLSDFYEYRVFPDVNNVKKYSLKDLEQNSCRAISFYPYNEVTAIAEHINASGKALLLAAWPLSELSNDRKNSISEFCNYVRSLALDQANTYYETEDDLNIPESLANIQNKLTDYEYLQGTEQADNELLKDEDLSVEILCAIKAMRRTINTPDVYVAIKGCAKKGSDLQQKLHKAICRELFVGRSTKQLGWTDGETFIALNIEMFRRLRKGPSYLEKIMMVYIHEICHIDEECHNHNASFFELFHRILVRGYDDGNTVTTMVRHFIKYYLEYLGKEGMKATKKYETYFATKKRTRKQLKEVPQND